MKDQSKTKQVLIQELASLRQRISELERADSELKRVVEEKRLNQEKAERMAKEMTILAEIGQLISSTLYINEVYEQFARRAQKLVSFDRLSVDLNNPDETTSIVTYVSGFDIPGRRPGDTIPLVGTISETILRTRTGLLIKTTVDGKITGRFSHVTNVATIHAGMRSLISVPLISRDRVIGTLHFRSKKPNAYTEQDLRLIEGVGDQIAGAIANAQLFLERKQAEVALQLAHDELEQRVASRTEELMRVNEVLRIEITERERAEEELKASKDFTEAVLDNLTDSLIIVDPVEYTIMGANKTFVNSCRLDKDTVIGKRCYELTHNRSTPCSFPNDICPLVETLKTGKPTTSEHIHYDSPGSKLYFEVSTIPIINKGGVIHQIIHLSRDITERKLAQEELQASLKEKEILLREVHHRVKNNMGVISGLLSLKASSSENPEVIQKLQESKQQIQSMALIHEKLYGEKDWTSIDLGSYVTDMVRNLSEFYQGGLNNIATKIKADESRLSVDKAIPLGLIMNELVSNAFKYAFPKGRPGEVEIVIRKTENGEIELIVRDNGEGLPEGFDPHKTESVGLYLVNGLVKNQLHGEMSVGSEGGTEFRIRFLL